MQLLRLQDVPADTAARIYRHPRLRALLLWLAVAGSAAFLLARAFTEKWPPGYIFGVPLLLFVLLMRRFVSARFHRSNWLVRMTATDLFVQYRSYLNFQLAADEPSVLVLSLGEIASARLIRERLEQPDPAKPGTTQIEFLHYIDLELSGDTAELTQALQIERSQSAPMHKHWYGSSSTLYRDYPVTMNDRKVVRIHWNVVPRAQSFLNALRPYTAIADPVSLTRDERTRPRQLAPRGENRAGVG